MSRRNAELVERFYHELWNRFELGEDGWLLGFSTGFGQPVLRRKVASRDREAVRRAIEWAR